MADTVRLELLSFDDLTTEALHDVLKLRSDVFIVEQGITAEPDLDGLDPEALHVLGRDPEGRIVATARVEVARRPVKVARVAVDPAWRRRGVGGAVMRLVHDWLAGRPAVLSAQANVVPWYERLGWRPVGEVHEEAGVPHRRMTRDGAP